MQGIELSQRFYLGIVRPWLASRFPLRHAAALTGYGSELLGFDDSMSRDHNWGPRVHLVVSQADFDSFAKDIISRFTEEAPSEFMGEPIGWRARPNPPPDGPASLGAFGHGLEVHTLEGKLQDILGVTSTANLTVVDWLGFAEQALLGFTTGAVFADDNGHLTKARADLTYFPRDVWLYKIACQWRRIAEAQAFVGRTGLVGDDLGSRIIAAQLAEDVMRMAFLLNRRYAPYAKWFGTAFKALPLAKALSPILAAVLDARDWQTRGEALAATYMALADYQVGNGLALNVVPRISPYHDRPFATINADDLVSATRALIGDPTLSALPVIGAIDQVSDNTPVLVDPNATRATTLALLGPALGEAKE